MAISVSLSIARYRPLRYEVSSISQICWAIGRKLGTKISIDTGAVYLGLRGVSPPPANNMNPAIYLSGDRVVKIIDISDLALKKNRSRVTRVRASLGN